MGVAVRYKKEDPWERIRLMADAVRNTPLQFMSTGFRFISWETAQPDFMALAFRVLARNGIRRFCLADPMNDADSNVACARMVKHGGGEYVIAALVFTLSPVHDDAHYADAARKLAACADIDALYIKDPGGLLSPQRARTLIPAITAVIGDKPLELHAHCTIGLAEHTYMDAPGYGVSVLQCASGGAADGTSNPLAVRVVANLRALGHSVRVDDDALLEVDRYFTRLAQAEGLPMGTPQAFDAAYLQHQLPGGMVGTMRRQLAESRLSHLEGAVIEEIGRVREELGWPIVMTPFAQIVMTQAVMNVTSKERYAVIPDEAIRYAIGRFGRPNVPIAAQVMERIDSLPRTRELRAEPHMPSLAELRKNLGANLSDEEFLLRATMPAGLVDAMRAAGAAARHYDPVAKPVMSLIRQLTARRDLSEVSVRRADFHLELRRHESAAPGGAAE
jgi:oxaloacetate decarboxylase alpha subunit